MFKNKPPDLVDGMTHDEMRAFFERDPDGFNEWSKEVLQSEIDKLSGDNKPNLIEMPCGGFSVKPQLLDTQKAIDALREYERHMNSFALGISSMEIPVKTMSELHKDIKIFLKNVNMTAMSIKYWNVVPFPRNKKNKTDT